MSGNEKNIPLYSASDIQKYLRGELSAPEMHRLERAALEDPLLSDALEGMELHHAHPSLPSFPQDMDQLRQRLDARVNKKDRKGALLRLPSSWKVAAAIILLLGLGLTAYYTFLNTGKQKESLAKVAEQQKTLPPPATADTISGKEHPAVASPAQEKASGAAASPEQAPTTAAIPKAENRNKQLPDKDIDKEAPRSPKPAAITSTDKVADDLAKANPNLTKTTPGVSKTAPDLANVLANKTPGVAIRRDQETLPATTVPPTVAPGAAAEQVNANAAKKSVVLRGAASIAKDTVGYQASAGYLDQPVYTGKVIDQNNRPLSGASLYLTGNNSFSSTVTDKNGLFSLRLPEKDDSAVKLTVASVGYEQASLGLSMQNRRGNIIQLQPQNNAVNEVVVTGYGSKRKEILKNYRQPRKQFVTKNAAPVAGWPAYESYLDVNKKIINPDSTLKGYEIISFLVNKEGSLSSFKVEQSLSPAHDSAAIHLIQQGPSWKLLKGKKTRVWVTIPF